MRYNPKSPSMIAVFASIVLTTIAFLFIFVGKPGGFESQIAYFFVALPGSIPAIILKDWLGTKSDFVFRTFLGVFNFIWYFILSFGALQVWKLGKKLRAEG